MNSEALLVVILFCAGLVPVVLVAARGHRRGRPRTVAVCFAALWLAFPLTLMLTAVNHPDNVVQEEPITYRPIEQPMDGYVASRSCQQCHPHEYATWHASYHRTMTQVTTPDNALGDFSDVTVSVGQLRYHMFESANRVWVQSTQPDGTTARRPAVLSTGSHHMQAYWFPLLADSRAIGMLPLIYLTQDQRWIPRSSAFLQPPHDPSIELGRWNEVCIRCHSTHGEMRLPRAGEDQSYYDLREIDTRVAEFGIACEACHGPAEQHVRVNRHPARRYRLHLSKTDDQTIQNPRDLSHQRSSQVCGQCHAVLLFRSDDAYYDWAENGHVYRPGDDLSRSRLRFIVQCSLDPDSALMERVVGDQPDFFEGSFWSDGMVRVSGREFNGLLESPCYQRGEMSCLSCHRMHQSVDDPRPIGEWTNDQLRPGMDGNQACLQCHQEYLQADDLQSHTHHPAASTGSDCMNCHMSYTTYGLLKAMRSHQVDTPDLSVSLQTGRPHACNQCHLDRTLAWTAEHLQDWYGHEPPELSLDQQNIAASVLWLLTGDAGQRALMAWSYGWQDARAASGDQWLAPYLAQLLEDPYDAVRLIAYRSLRSLPGYANFDYDFLGSSEQRARDNRRALQQWLAASAARSGPAPQVLLDPQGRLAEDEFQRLLKMRDDRPVGLNE